MSKKTKLMLGDNISSLKKLPDNSIDSVVTDPPYGLSFMNKKWDYDVPSVDFWKEVYRVLKPGGHVLSFGGTRTYHRMVVNIEDAGFEIRDQIMWLYGSGFPKSHNIGKAVDKLQGNERVEWLDEKKTQPNIRGNGDQLLISSSGVEVKDREPIKHSKGNSEWEGWGTALKPANEPICVARKPLSEKTVAKNVLKWRTGGINIDGCRVKFDNNDTNPATNPLYRHQNKDKYKQVTDHGQNEGVNVKFTNSLNPPSEEGRFPANIILDEIAAEYLDEQSGVSKGVDRKTTFVNYGNGEYGKKDGRKTHPTAKEIEGTWYGDKGGASRFFKIIENYDVEYLSVNGIKAYVIESDITPKADRFQYIAKVSKKERNMGLDHFEDKVLKSNQINVEKINGREVNNPKESIVKNTHPTIKPVKLMAYLCRLVTPENGIVLDPFMGSGSTGIAARLEGFRFCGMEMDEDYYKIAEARIDNFEDYRQFVEKK